jgi:hypothetical protein
MLNGLTKIKKIFFDILTFSYVKYRLITFLSVLALLFVLPVSFFERIPNLSICSRVFGNYCYSVGITRGVSSLLKGNLSQAINYNFLAIPVLIVLISFILVDAYQLIKKKSARKTNH